MGKIVGVRDQDVHHLITQAYQAGGAYQWAREAAVNAIQAAATWIRFGVEEQGFAHSGVARRFIADNGIGMSEEDLRIFLSSFGGGGRTIGMGQNFGQGFKSSCYEWNPYGIVVASWSESTPDGRMIWIHRQQDGSNIHWALKDFEYDAGDGDPEIEDCVKPTYLSEIGVDVAKLKTPEIEAAGHGTVFLFLGDGPERDTVNGDYLRDEFAMRGIVRYLNSRFIDLPEGVDIRVSALEAKTDSGTTDRRESKDTVIVDHTGARRTVHSRRVTGVRSWIRKDGTVTGTMTAKHGTTIQWYLTDQPDRGDQSYRPSKPQIMVKYENEAYNVRSDARTYRQFGIPDEVNDRVWLIIEPPRLTEGSTAWGVTPQASRGHLIAKGEMELPWDEWFDHFYTNMPRPIRDAIAESRSGDSAGDAAGRRERLKRVQSKFGSRWRPTVLLESIRGRIPGNPTATGSRPAINGGNTGGTKVKVSPSAKPKSSDTGSAGNTVILDPDKAGEAFGFERRKSDGIPEVVWDKEFVEKEERHFAVRFDPQEVREGSFGTVHFNTSWPMFQQQMQFWQEEYPRADSADVEKLVQTVYEDEVVSKIMHAYKLRNSVVGIDDSGTEIRLKREQVEQMTSAYALTTAVVGLVNVESRIRTSAGSRFGAAPSTKKSSGKRA